MARLPWLRFLRRPRASTARRPAYRPRLDALEDRTLLAAPVLDPSFGQGGVVQTSFTPLPNALPTESFPEEASRVALQADGKVVVAGTVGTFATPSHTGQVLLARYNADGSLDTTFGQGGRMLVPRVNDRLPMSVTGLAILSDGSFAVAGSSGEVADMPATSEIFVLHFKADGTPDPTFYANPVFTPGHDAAGGLALQPDGKLVVEGSTAPSVGALGDLVAFRLDVNGQLDPTFGQGGKADLGGGDVQAPRGPAVQNDGRIVFVGVTLHGGFTDGVLVRTTADGRPDPTFDADGRVDLDFDGHLDNPSQVLVQPDGKLLVVGDAGLQSQRGALTGVVTRLTADGQLDVTFGAGGKVSLQGRLFGPRGVLQPDGKLLLAGTTSPFRFENGQYTFSLARLNPDGSFDVTFGPGGFAARPLPVPYTNRNFAATDLALRPDGRFVVSGSQVQSAFTGDVALVQYAPGPEDPNQRFVFAVYADLLGRAVDAGGLANWSGLLARGISRFDVVRAIQASTEYRQAVVRDAYRRLLRRDPDAGGLASWTDFLAQGGTPDQLAASLLGSAEYLSRAGSGTADDFLFAVYQDVFGRFLDESGRQNWKNALAAGVSRATVALALLGSAEADARTVRGLYDRLLRRPADDGGLANFTQALQRGLPDDVVIALLTASAEYFNLAQ
jgi:uncharacterized delta-60 repeat protein